MKNILIIVFSSLLSALCAVGIYEYFDTDTKEVITIREPAKAQYANFKTPNTTLPAPSTTTDFVQSCRQVTPAVVNIKAVTSRQGNAIEDFWGISPEGASSGSGVIISSDGYIVTNHHVVENAKILEVSMNDKRTFKANLIGIDPTTDLALIKIDETDLPSVTFGDSDNAQIGEWVLAVGNPFNLNSTVTAGIVSAKGRNIDILEGDYSIESFIQTDAAVNPGNSGGALVNTRGQLIGINTAIITRSGRYEGYSFAVPSNLVRKVVSDLKEFGQVQRGLLGVIIRDVNSEIAKDNKLASLDGVYIDKVNANSAALDAGLKGGDIITHINKRKIRAIPELQEQVGRFRPGNKIEVTILRNGATLQKDVVLKNRNNSTKIVKKTDAKLLDLLGFELRDLTNEENRKLKIAGVKVLSVTKGSKIDRTNMDPGFIITKINDIKVENVDQVIRQIKNAQSKVMLEGVYEDYPGEYYYAFAK